MWIICPLLGIVGVPLAILHPGLRRVVVIWVLYCIRGLLRRMRLGKEIEDGGRTTGTLPKAPVLVKEPALVLFRRLARGLAGNAALTLERRYPKDLLRRGRDLAFLRMRELKSQNVMSEV